jgi:N-acetylglucosaminyldiphosphoundecaprenol N-acetyl-beta-D-mannosaminyltransferase
MAQVVLFIVRAPRSDLLSCPAALPFMSTHDTLSEAHKINENSQAEVSRTNPRTSNPVLSVPGTDHVEASFFGLTVQPMSSPELMAVVEQGISENRRWVVTNHNLHSVFLFHRHQKLREFYKSAHWTFIDGMPLIALGKFYGYALEREQRVTLADWIHPLMETAARKGWRVFNLGSPEGVAEKGAVVLRRLYPGLQIEVSNGYFDARRDSAENEEIVQRINAYQPDLLMVGMGMPRQEFWTQENMERLNARVILASNGAAIDYVAGMVPTPPRWAGRLGLEWAFRLASEPRRLFGRYLLEPWYLLILLLMDFVRKGGRLNAVQRETLGETFGEGF